MMIRRPRGTNAVIGQSQGFLGLPIYHGKYGDGTPFMISAWEPTREEIAGLNEGQSIYVRLLTNQHPPIMLGVGVPNEIILEGDSKEDFKKEDTNWIRELQTAIKLGALMGRELHWILEHGPDQLITMIYSYLEADNLGDAVFKSVTKPITIQVIEDMLLGMFEKKVLPRESN